MILVVAEIDPHFKMHSCHTITSFLQNTHTISKSEEAGVKCLCAMRKMYYLARIQELLKCCVFLAMNNPFVPHAYSQTFPVKKKKPPRYVVH